MTVKTMRGGKNEANRKRGNDREGGGKEDGGGGKGVRQRGRVMQSSFIPSPGSAPFTGMIH